MSNLNPIGADPNLPPGVGATAPHAPAGDTEEVYYQGSPLLRGEIGRGFGWIAAGLFFIALVVAWFILQKDHQINWWVALAVVAVGAILIAVPFFRAKTISYRITNYRIDFQRGLLSTNIDTIELWHIEDLRFHQSLLAKMLGIGTITVLSKHPTTPALVMRSIPNARNLFTTLEQRVIAVKRQGGVIKVDAGT